MTKKKIRKIILIFVLILEGLISVGYSHEIYKIAITDSKNVNSSSKLIVDGTDFSPLADLMESATSGLVDLLSIIFCIVFTTIFTLLLAVILRVATIRKNEPVEEVELKFSIKAIVISSFITFLAGILFSNIYLIFYTLALSWQQPLFMILIYFLRLKKGSEIYEKNRVSTQEGH